MTNSSDLPAFESDRLGADPRRATFHMKATRIHDPQFCKTTVPTKRLSNFLPSALERFSQNHYFSSRSRFKYSLTAPLASSSTLLLSYSESRSTARGAPLAT
jgi:hypothetical protein